MTKAMHSVLLGLCAGVLAATAVAQEAPAQDGKNKDPAAVLREEAKASADAEAKGAADADADGEDAAPDAPPADDDKTQAGQKDADGDFVPTEKIWADSAIAFPADI
jgi:hypothetical protein